MIITMLLYNFAGGGAEKMLLHLAEGLTPYAQVKLLLPADKMAHPFVTKVKKSTLALVPIPVTKAHFVPWLLNYLQENPTDIIFTGKVTDDALLLPVWPQLAYQPACYSRVGTDIVQKWREKFFRLKWLDIWQEYRYYQAIFAVYRGVFAVNHSVAKSLQTFVTKAYQAKIFVVPNPTLPNNLPHLLTAVSARDSSAPPLLVAIGRLSKVKNFALLLKAIAQLRAKLPLRLWLLGDGPERRRLERLAVRLQIADYVDFKGFVANVFDYLPQADLLVLTSRREGSPNVLIEALACGVPVVATDCPSGPREILQNGRLGTLVPVNDVNALANAIFSALNAPKQPDVLKQAAQVYSQAHSAACYWQVLSATALSSAASPMAAQ
jgi:glycosyltransferase involved in cell wall biosynthesis